MHRTNRRLAVRLLALAVAACGPSAGPPGASGPLDGGADAGVLLSCPNELPGAAGLFVLGVPRLFGEVHGTHELPGFVGDVACLAAREAPVTLGLELPVVVQAAIDVFLASDGGADDRAALSAGAFWTTGLKDGRSSVAMADLIERARALRRQGADLKVLAFDQTLAGQPRDASMAEKITDAIRTEPERFVIALVGNLHARTVVGTPFDPSVENMGFVLLQRFPALESFDAEFQSGTAWVCSPNCGVTPLTGGDSTAQRWIEKFPAVSSDGYHGRFHAGAITAALPERP